MKTRLYLTAAALSAMLAAVLSLSSCRALEAAIDPSSNPEQTAKIEHRLDQVEQVAQTTATVTAGIPGLGGISAIAAVIAAAVAAAHGAWRNQTRKTDPTVSNFNKPNPTGGV